MEFIWFLIIGLIAGWIAGLLVRGRGFGMIADIVIGIVGAFIGGLIFRSFGMGPSGFWGSLATAVIGALILLFIVKLFRGHTA
ncbi:MAG: GlsB/YeaQ/YmgE family stress response membrane protein [Candidatus Buchananbacteria bacterium]